MKIDQSASDMFLIWASMVELEGLQQCLNEACSETLIENFEKWIGTSRQYVAILLSDMILQPAVEGHRESIRADFFIEKDSFERIRIYLSKENLRIIGSCLYEVCNRIRLYEFRLRTGIDLEVALAIYRAIEDALNHLPSDQ